jgi:hypothetical protein
MTPQQAECPDCDGSGRIWYEDGMDRTMAKDCPNPIHTAPIEAQEAHDPKEIRREADGRYGFDGNWDRLCVCGHSLGVHAAQNDTGKRPCFNEDSGIVGGTGEPCDCEHFRPSKKKPHPEATQGTKYIEKVSTWCNICGHDHAMGIAYDHKPVNEPKCTCGHSFVSHWHGPVTAECTKSLCDCKRYKPQPDELSDVAWVLDNINPAAKDEAKAALLAYLTATATRMAVEARVDEIERVLDNIHQGTLEVAVKERLAELQAQLKNGDKS